MTAGDDPLRITTTRLELLLLDRSVLARWLAGESALDLGFADPARFLSGADDVVRLRLEQIDADPTIAPWLLRAMVLRDERIAVGFIGFHAGPDARAMVEIGYEVLPLFRRQGYAREACAAMLVWAARRGVHVVRASVSPDNAASLALIAQQGFVHVGEQLDELDGRELVFEKLLAG